jgi:hypothetical protein
MSTKIYDGKRLPDMSVLELHQFCQKLKAQLLPIAKTEYFKIMAQIAQDAYVYAMTGKNISDYPVNMSELGKPNADFSLYEVFLFAKQQTEKMVTNTSNAIRRIDAVSDADFDVTLCVFPLPDKTLCIPYANHDKLHESLFSVEEFADYAYWNNTDPASNVTSDEWEQRKIDWHTALPGAGVPRDNGMLFKIIDAPYDIVNRTYATIDMIKPFFISDDELRKKVAKSSILEREFQKAVDELGGDWVRNGYKGWCKAQEYVKTHGDEIDQMANELKKTVKFSEFFTNAD